MGDESEPPKVEEGIETLKSSLEKLFRDHGLVVEVTPKLKEQTILVEKQDAKFEKLGGTNQIKIQKLLDSKVMPDNAFGNILVENIELIGKAGEHKVEERRTTREEWQKAWDRLEKSIQSKGGTSFKDFNAGFDKELEALESEAEILRIKLNHLGL